MGGGPKTFLGTKKKVRRVIIDMILEVFAFCGQGTKTSFKDRASRTVLPAAGVLLQRSTRKGPTPLQLFCLKGIFQFPSTDCLVVDVDYQEPLLRLLGSNACQLGRSHRATQAPGTSDKHHAVYIFFKLYLLCFSRDKVPSENLMVVSDTVDIVRRGPANTGDQLSVTGLT